MAEAALFTVASKILSTVAGPAFQKAYERACSVWDARVDLDQLRNTILTIQAVLLDAERKQNGSSLVKVWIKRVKDVLYDADDLFDEVATDDLIRRLKGSNKMVKKVLLSGSRLNPFGSNNDIANRVQNIRKSLSQISEDMRVFHFVQCLNDNPVFGMGRGEETGSFVHPDTVIGRDEDTEVILKMLLHDQSNDAQQGVQVIAIVGIGGMGKTTLTQLVYNTEEVERSFEKRWFACISDSSNDVEISRKICQSMSETDCGNLTLNALQIKIKEMIEGKKFLLVLDDVWFDDPVTWETQMRLLSSGAKKGSKIIVSTRLSSVVTALGALRTHYLNGLSDESAWLLFKRVARFTPEQEEDSTRTYLGIGIVKKCRNVPLAINCIASLLRQKNSIEEWESIRNEELPQLGQRHKDGIMPVLKLSYEHLSSNLKHCFAYCSLFPKDHIFEKDELINLWIAQGYINPNIEKQMVEDVGHCYFMDLLGRSFFQADFKDNQRFRMHDLIHDLAIHVAGEESIMLTASSNKIGGTRHASVGYVVDESWVLPEPLDSANRLRSLLFPAFQHNLHSRLVLVKQFENLKSLRALSISQLGIENIPSSVGELKHLRYLDISCNDFKKLPDSITKLVNLCTLNISFCGSLEAWPSNFRKLINLRHLHNFVCYRLNHMPPGFEELSSLQRLDEFRVGQRFQLDALSQLKLRGELSIWFEDNVTDDWDGVECWQPPLTLQQLEIWYYNGARIPNWGDGRMVNPSLLPKLTSLSFCCCPRVKCLPPFRHIPNLKQLDITRLEELEYIEEEEAGSDALFIPDLERLKLESLPKLKGWSRKVEHDHSSSTSTTALPHQLLSFPNLSYLDIIKCLELMSIPLCPRLRSLHLKSVAEKQIQLLHLLPISGPTPLSSCLEHVSIDSFDWLESFPGETLTSLQRLEFYNCIKLKRVELAPLHLNTLKYLKLKGCPELELWEEKKRGVDWDSLHKLIELAFDEAPSSVRLPDCLLRRRELCQLKIEILDSCEESVLYKQRLNITGAHLQDLSTEPQQDSNLHTNFSMTNRGTLNLSPSDEIRPASDSSPSEITLSSLPSKCDALPAAEHLQLDYVKHSRPSHPYDMSIDVQRKESILVTHHPDSIATGMENQGASSHEELFDRQVLEPEKEMEGKGILYLFGEDYEFEKEMLIQLWMALGLLTDEPMEVIGANFFEKLESEGYILCSVSNSLYKVNAEELHNKSDMILDKQNYVIIDNGSRNDVASTETLHVSVVCDGIDKTVFKTLGRFNKLRTLLFLGNYGSRLQQVPRDLFLCYESLLALDLSGTHIKELPSSANKMVCLRYLDLSWTFIKLLPESIDRFKKLQTLKLKGCSRIHRLPREIKGLTELRHLDLDVLGQLTAFPEGMGALVNLRTLSAFPIGTGEGCKISELKHLNNLRGEFCIANLENLQTADEAKDASLTAKRSIKSLELRWSDYQLQEPKNEDESILENLCPHLDLQEIQIICYPGTSFPGWISDTSFHKLVSITLFRCEHISMLPFLGELPSLKTLKVVALNSVAKIDCRGQLDNVAFPVLQKLAIDEMHSLEVWIEAQEGDYPCLTELSIKDCPKLPELPSLLYLPSLEQLELSGCDNLAFVSKEKLSSSLQQLTVEDCTLIKERCSKQGGPDRHKIYHIPSIWIDQEAY